MRYEVGKKFYKVDDKGNTKTIIVTDVVYKLEGTLRKYMSEKELEEFIEKNEIATDSEAMKRLKIKMLEEELNIKLKEV